MSDYTEFFLNSRASVVQLDCLEISHSAFSQTRYIVRNAAQGTTVTHEDDTDHDYIYVPMRFSRAASRDDLEQALLIELGDLGEIVPSELDLVRAGDAFGEKPVVIYRTYKSTDLTTPLYGPLFLEIKTFNINRTGCSFEAKAPSLNISRTGETYTIPRFPMLKGLL